MASVLTDCPHRENWVGWNNLSDAILPAISLQYVPNVWQDNKRYVSVATEEGMIPSIAPEYVRFKEGFEDTPEWGSAFIISSWYSYLWYGDDRALTEFYPAMKRYMNYLASRAKRSYNFLWFRRLV